MKIKRYQNGGISYTPFFRDAAEPTQVATQTSKTSENKEEQLIQKEIINVLKENGLPNDVDYFLDRANSFLRKSQNLGELFVSGQSNQYDMSDLIRYTLELIELNIIMNYMKLHQNKLLKKDLGLKLQLVMKVAYMCIIKTAVLRLYLQILIIKIHKNIKH